MPVCHVRLILVFVCVCCDNWHWGCFVSPCRWHLEPDTREGRGQSSHVCYHNSRHVHTFGKLSFSEWRKSWRASGSAQCFCPPLTPLSNIGPCPSPFLFPSSFHLPHLHPFCPLLHYLLPFCSSTCPCRVHPSDPVTLAGRQIASTPTNLGITLLSSLVDQIALTVYQQTQWDSMMHSHTQQWIITSWLLLSLIRLNARVLVLASCLFYSISVS